MTKPVTVFCVTTPMSIPLFGNRFHLLVEAGIDLHIVVGGPISESIPELPTEAQVHVIPMTRSIDPIGDLIALVKMVTLQRKLRPKLVAAATPKASLIGLLAARINRVPVRVWEVWGARWETSSGTAARILWRIDRQVAKLANHILAVSPSLAALLQSTGLSSRMPHVIANGSTHGVDTALFRPPLEESHEPGVAIVGFVGRLNRDKGIDDAIAAAIQVKAKYPELTLHLIGSIDATNPPNPQTLEAIRNHEWIHVTGWVSDVSKPMSRLQVLLFPSRREGLPNAVLEASALGIPTIAYDATGTRDVVVHRSTGYLAETNSIDDLARYLEHLLDHPELRRQLGAQARTFVSQTFDSHYVEQNFTQHYKGLMN